MEENSRIVEEISTAAATAEAEAPAVATSSTEAEGQPKTGSARSSADMLRAMDGLAIRMGVYSEGVSYLLDSGASGEAVLSFMEKQDAAAADVVAKQLNLDAEGQARIKDRSARTDEERLLIDQVTLQSYAQRLSKYITSNYLASLGIISKCAQEALGVPDDQFSPQNPDTAPLIRALNMLNRYFYVGLHKELNPLEERSITEAEEAELIKITQEFLTFHKAQDKPPEQSVVDYISPAMGDITELTSQSDSTFLPISLVWRDQRNIARRGAEGALENVGKNTEAGAVNVSAFISDKDGKPLAIDAVMQGVQAAIGQLIDENGRVLPLIVTPQQVYRAFARLPNDAKVTSQQAAEMERAMDALMFSPSFIDFTVQLEKHKKIKHQSDYDYKAENAGRLSGNLISMTKGEGTNRQGERQVAYKVYDYPVLYRYSHIIGQIAKVPNKLITGSEKPAIKDKKAAEAQRNALSIGMRRNVYTKITLWRSRIKNHQPISPVLTIKDIADDCGITLTEKSERTLRKNIQLYLDELQAQGIRNGGIKNYQLRRYGRHVVGFYVEL